MDKLKHIDAFSAAKMAAAIELIFGFVIAVFIFLFAASLAGVLGPSHLPTFLRGAAIIIALPVFLAVVGFMVVAIEAFLYNEISYRTGSIRLDLGKNRGRLNSIDTMSTAKVFAACGAIVGALIGIIVAIVGLASGSLRFAALGVASIFILAICLAVGLFVMAVVLVYVYNFVASKIGGVKFSLNGRELSRVDPMSYAKIEAVIGAIIGFIAGAFRTIAYFASLSAHTSTAGAFAIITYPILYFIIGFASTFVQAWVYNALVPRIGGVKLTINKSG
ncbi:MAG: hypothetical protein KGI06_00780 [Candidatus Micrarchaeota archaeon]|nr:hypothetical protein [Candidatus Micrarchaeota archaeon]